MLLESRFKNKEAKILIGILLAAILGSFFSPTIRAGELPAQFDAEKLKTYLSSSPEKCVLAIGEMASKKGGSPVYPIYCIWDGVTNQGSVYETRGCMLGKFEASNGRYNTLGYTKQTVSKETTNKSCDKDMVLKIINEIPLKKFGYYDSVDANVEKISFGKFLKKQKTVLLYDKFGVWK